MSIYEQKELPHSYPEKLSLIYLRQASNEVIAPRGTNIIYHPAHSCVSMLGSLASVPGDVLVRSATMAVL